MYIYIYIVCLQKNNIYNSKQTLIWWLVNTYQWKWFYSLQVRMCAHSASSETVQGFLLAPPVDKCLDHDASLRASHLIASFNWENFLVVTSSPVSKETMNPPLALSFSNLPRVVGTNAFKITDSTDPFRDQKHVCSLYMKYIYNTFNIYIYILNVSVCCKPINTLRKKLWIEPNRPAYLAIEDLIHQRQLLLAKSLATQRDFLVIQPWISVLPKIRWFRHSLAVGSCWTFHVCACMYIYIYMHVWKKQYIHVQQYARIATFLFIYIYMYVKIHMMPLLALPSFELDQIFAENLQKWAGSHPCSWLVSIRFDLKNPAAPLISNLKPEQVQERLQNKHVHHHIDIYIWYIYELKCSKKSSVLIYIDTFWVFQQYVRYFWMNMCTSWTTNKKLYIYVIPRHVDLNSLMPSGNGCSSAFDSRAEEPLDGSATGSPEFVVSFLFLPSMSDGGSCGGGRGGMACCWDPQGSAPHGAAFNSISFNPETSMAEKRFRFQYTMYIYILCKKMQLFHVRWDRWHNKIIIHLYIYISLLYHKWQGCILTSDAETCAAVGDCSYQP